MERTILYKTLKDVAKELGVSRKKVHKLFYMYLEASGLPREVFKFKASWGGWFTAFTDYIFEDFVEFGRTYLETGEVIKPKIKVRIEEGVSEEEYEEFEEEKEEKKSVEEAKVEEKAPQVVREVDSSRLDRLRSRLLIKYDEEAVGRVLNVVKFLMMKGLYGKSLVSVSQELREMGLPEKRVREITSYYRVALLYEY